MVCLTEEKPLLVSIMLVVLPAILAFPTFTVILMLVCPRVGVLPMLLLATVMILLPVRSVPISCSPRLGSACVKALDDLMTPRSLAPAVCLSLGLSIVVGLLLFMTFTLCETVAVAFVRLLATTPMMTFVRR